MINPSDKIVRAVHPNAGVQRWYETTLEAFIRRMARDIERRVLAAYSEIEPVEMALDAPRNPSLLMRSALRKWGGLWIKKFEKFSDETAAQFARKNFSVTQTQMKAAFKDAGFTVSFQPTAASVAAYQGVIAEQVNLIRSIPAEYLKAVQSQVWASVMKGGDQYALQKNLQKSYGVTARRAAVIARDQNNKAKATIEQTRRVELGCDTAVWVHSSGGKVPRRTHIAMDGKPYKIAVGMWDRDEGEYVLPGQLINCRCTSKAVIPAFDTVKAVQSKLLRARNNELFAAASKRSR